MFSPTPPDADVPKSKKKLTSFSIFHKGTLVIVLVTLMLTLALVWFDFVVKQKVTGIEKQWHDYSNEATFASHVLSRIQTNFGYGGFIHNFKNYVLRKDAELVPKIEKSLAETRRAINDYPLHGIIKDLDDEIYLNGLTQVVDQYVVNFELAQRLIAKGVSSNDIDRQVKVNDALAFQAIEHLSQHAVERNDEYALETNKRLNNALNFINWGLLLVPLVLLSGIFMLVLLRKITEINRSLEESRKFLSQLFEAAADSIVVTDSDECILRVNSAFSMMTGYSSDEAIGKTPGQLLKSGKHDDEFYKLMWTALNEKGNWKGEIWDRRKDGSFFPARHHISAVKDTQGKVIQYISIFLDITEQKRAEERIQYLAQHDQLTKLPNRALFNDRFQHSIDRAQRSKKKIGLMFLDLDGFKDVNDSLGHQAGDELLQIIADRLSNIMRTDDTVARIGGDEFTIILEDLEHSDYASVVAKKVLQTVGEAIYLSGQEVIVGASIGISIYPDNGADANSLIKNADTAMYQAKKQGKNCYKFYIKNH